MEKLKVKKNFQSKPFFSYFILIIALLNLKSCYLWQQTKGQFALRFQQIPIQTAIQKEDNQDRKRLLSEIPKILNFAENILQLKKSNNYTGYYEVQDGAVTYTVIASKPFEFKPYTWWFPIIGRVPYKGFFNKLDALREEENLKQQGYDTWISKIPAYSTLGWFKDPVTSPMLDYGFYYLVETIFHELTHIALYVNGNTNFNEQLASFVGKKGAIQYFKEYVPNGIEILKQQKLQKQRSEKFRKLVFESITTLKILYLQNLPDQQKNLQKQAILNQLNQQISKVYPTSKKVWQFNNARLLQYKRYQKDHPLFEEIWEKSQKDWKTFWKNIHLKVETF